MVLLSTVEVCLNGQNEFKNWVNWVVMKEGCKNMFHI